MKSRWILTLLWGSTGFSQTLTLKDYLSRVESENGLSQSSKLRQQAAPLAQETGDLALSPQLTAGISSLDDQKETAIPAFQGTRTRLDSTSVGLAKKFSTGTTVSTDISQNRANVSGTTPATVPQYSTAAGLTLSQSLWQDFFGRSTQLRRSREDLTTRLDLYAEDLKARKVLVDAEAAYWLFALKANEVAFRQGAFERAQRIYKWQSARSSSGLANRSDLLQATALLTSRRLQLEQSQDELKAATVAIADFAHLDQSMANVQPVADELMTARTLNNPGGESIRRDALLTVLESKLKQSASDEIAEQLKPQLNLDLKYASNGYDAVRGGSWSELGQFDTPTLYGGLRLQLPLDFEATSHVRQAAKFEAQAAESRAQQVLRESKTSWSELTRRYSELGRRIQTMIELVKIQKEKAEVENGRLSNGRSTTFQVVQFEQDYADAQLGLLQMLSEARKIEAQSQLFEKVSNK